MLKFFKSVGRFLENSERNFPKTFWLHASLLASFLSYIGDIPRGGENNSDIGSFIPPISINKPPRSKGKNFDPAFHRRLEQYFPDWDGRMVFQKKQEELYKSAMQKKREALRLRLKENFNRTPEEQDAVDYFMEQVFMLNTKI